MRELSRGVCFSNCLRVRAGVHVCVCVCVFVCFCVCVHTQYVSLSGCICEEQGYTSLELA